MLARSEENEMIFQVLHHGLDLLSRAAQPKLIFDLLVIKTAMAETLVKVVDEGINASAQLSDRGSPRPSLALTPPPAIDPVIPIVEAQKLVPEVNLAAPATVQSLPNFGFNSSSPKPTKAAAKDAVPVMAGHTGPKTWDGFIEFCDRKAPAMGVILESVVEHVLPTAAAPHLRLGFREHDQSKVDQVNLKAFRDQLVHVIEAYFGTRATVEVFYSQIKGESVAEKTERLKNEVRDQRMQSILANEVIQEAKALFGADLTNIELIEKDS